MLKLRKIDYYGQLILATLMVLSIPVLLIYGFLAGLFIMGCWQLLSATLNTAAFKSLSQRKQILLYWTLCMADLAVLTSGRLVEEIPGKDLAQFVYGAALVGSVLTAIYYLKIYNNLIELISLRNELDGLTKSKH